MYNIINSLVYSFQNCVCLQVSYADGITLYSIVICHHSFKFGQEFFTSIYCNLRGYLVNHAISTWLATRSVLAQNIFLSSRQLGLSWSLPISSHLCLSCLSLYTFLPPLLGVILRLLIRSIHSVSHDNFFYYVLETDTYDSQNKHHVRTFVGLSSENIDQQLIDLVSPGWHSMLWYHSTRVYCICFGTTNFPFLQIREYFLPAP